MSILWVLLLTLQACHSQAVDEHLVEKDEHERQDCPSESCSANRRPVTVVQSETLYLAEPTRQKKTYDGEGVIKTNFTCERKPYIPGFYADEEADCKVFHLCMKTVVEHYLCPNGTVFDQLTMVCEREHKVQCNVTRYLYVMNSDLSEERPLFPGRKDYTAVNKGSDKWMQDVVRGDKGATDQDSLERNLIRALILVHLINVPDALTSHVGKRNSREYYRILKEILHDAFPLLPVMYNSEKVILSRKPDYSKKRRVPRSMDATETLKQKLSRIETSSNHSNSQSAEQIIEFIFGIIGEIAGKISRTSRSSIVANYIQRFLNTRASDVRE